MCAENGKTFWVSGGAQEKSQKWKGWENRELESNIHEGIRGRTGDPGARLRRSDLS